MAELFENLSLVAFGIAILFFLFAIFVWFRLRILSVINDLTGKTAKKAIEQIRTENAVSGNKSYRSSRVNLKRGSLTTPMSDTAKEATATVKLPESSQSKPMEETTLFQEDGKTEMLFSDDSTTLLHQESKPKFEGKTQNRVAVTILEEVVWIHTSEVIP